MKAFLRAAPFLIPAFVYGAPAGGFPILPLDTVLARVASRNPEIAAWRSKAEARAAAASGASALMAPELGAGGTALPYGDMASGMAPGDPALMISARQMFPGPGKRTARRAYLESLAGAEREQGAWVGARLRADAKTRYAALAAASRRLAVLREAEAVMAWMVQTAESRFRLRRADLAAVYEARARLAELESMRAEEEGMEALARSDLAHLMAAPDSAAFSADTSLALKGYAARPPEAAPGARGDIRRADRELAAMERGLESMRRANRPDFGIQFDHMEMFGMGRRFSVMAMATLPAAPWSRGMARADAASMRKEIAAMRADRGAMILMARRMAAEALLMLGTETARYEAARDSVAPAYKQALDAATAGFQEGNGDWFRVLDAWDRWLMARMDALVHFEKASALEAEYEREAGLR